MELEVAMAALFGLSAICLSRQLRASTTDEITAEIPTVSVSVVIPAFDEEEYIQDLIASLKTQSIPPTEIITAVDSRTTDATAKIATDNGATVVYSGPGKLTAKNIGAQHAHGDIIIFLDADVKTGPNLFATLLRHFTNKYVMAVGGSVLYGSILEQLIGSLRNAYYFPLAGEMIGNVTAIRRDAFFTIGCYNESIDQCNRFAVLFEEEFNIGVRIQKIGGQFIVDSDAVVFLSRAVAPTLRSGDCTEKYLQQVQQHQRF